MKKTIGKKKKCKECGHVLLEEYEDCSLCGGGIVYLCSNDECGRMYDSKGDEL